MTDGLNSNFEFLQKNNANKFNNFLVHHFLSSKFSLKKSSFNPSLMKELNSIILYSTVPPS